MKHRYHWGYHLYIGYTLNFQSKYASLLYYANLYIAPHGKIDIYIYTMYTVCNGLYCLYAVQCTLYGVHCTLYDEQSIASVQSGPTSKKQKRYDMRKATPDTRKLSWGLREPRDQLLIQSKGWTPARGFHNRHMVFIIQRGRLTLGRISSDIAKS